MYTCIRRKAPSAVDQYVTAATAPRGTSFVSNRSFPATTSRLQTFVFDSLIDELRGSIVATSSMLKWYYFAFLG